MGNENAILPFQDEHVIRQFLLNHFSSVNLLATAHPPERGPDLSFSSNSEFWQVVLSDDAQPLSWVELPSFQLCDWFPRAPGVFHTEMAKYHRIEAKYCSRVEDGILHYEPYGKFNMIQGGLGTVRFGSIKIESIEHLLCTATTDNFCHTGIPLAIPDSEVSKINFRKNEYFRIVGQLKFLPKFLSEEYFGHYTRVRQLYIQVYNLYPLNEYGNPLTLSPMIYFSTEDDNATNHNVTYVHCKAHDNQDISRATDWIENYVERYGNSILTNFDQQSPTFENVPFSLQAIMANTIDAKAINSLHIKHANFVQPAINEIFAEKANMATNITVTLGDGTIIHGNMIVANSIKDSFTQAENADAPEEIKELLKELASAVGNLVSKLDDDKAEVISRDLKTLATEVTSSKPRQNRWKVSMDDITSVANKVADLGKPVLDILAKLTPLLIAVT